MKKILLMILFVPFVFVIASCKAPVSTAQEVKDFTLESVDGQRVSLSDFKGKVVLLVFGFSRCPYCVKEIPTLNKLHEEYAGKDFKIVYVNLSEGMHYVKDFVKRAGIKYLTLVDVNGTTAMMYGVMGVPANFLIDKKQSSIEMVDIYDNIEEKIDKLLNE